MTLEQPDRLPLAALLRSARSALGTAVRSALEGAGFEDLPANGPYVLSATALGEVQLAVIIERLGLSKQAAGHLVDLLVLRGYLDRRIDPQDRRRLVVALTERGTAAAEVTRQAAAALEDRLTAAVGPADVAATYRTLGWLATAVGDDA